MSVNKLLNLINELFSSSFNLKIFNQLIFLIELINFEFLLNKYNNFSDTILGANSSFKMKYTFNYTSISAKIILKLF